MVYEAVFRHLPCAIALVDAELTVRDATPAFADAVERPIERVIGSTLALVDGPEGGAGWRGALAAAEPFGGAVSVAPGRDVAVGIRPLSGYAPSLALVTVEEPGDPRVAALFDALRALKHEMNNPLTGALGNINLLLRRGDLDERARRRLTTAEQEIKKVSLLVMRLSELAPFNGTK